MMLVNANLEVSEYKRILFQGWRLYWSYLFWMALAAKMKLARLESAYSLIRGAYEIGDRALALLW